MVRKLKSLASNRRLVNIIKILIAVSLFLWLISSGRLDLKLLLSVPISLWYLLGIGVLLLSMLLQAFRWWWLVKAQDIPLPIGQAIQISWMAQFFSVLLPGAAGGEVVRAYYISAENPSAKVAGISTVLVDKVIGLYSLLLLGAAAVIYISTNGANIGSNIWQIGGSIFAMVLAITLLFIFLWYKPTRTLILYVVPGRFKSPVKGMLDAYGDRVGILVVGLIISIVATFFYILAFMMAGQALQTEVSWQAAFLTVPLITIANSLPIAPGGIGVAEAVASVLFAQLGVGAGASIMLLVRLWTMLLRLPGAFIYITRRTGQSRGEANTDNNIEPRYVQR